MKTLVAMTLALAAAASVGAAEPDLTKTPLDRVAASVLPKMQCANGIDYMNGGAGTEGVDYMKARQRISTADHLQRARWRIRGGREGRSGSGWP